MAELKIERARLAKAFFALRSIRSRHWRASAGTIIRPNQSILLPRTKGEEILDHTIVHFEIPATDTEKLKKFYSGVFGWKIDKGSEDMSGPMEYWLLGTVPTDKQMRPIRPGINGGMYKKTKETKDMKPIVYVSVESADEYINKIKKLGGKIIVPKQEVPHVGWTAIAIDPEGNQFAILQPMQP